MKSFVCTTLTAALAAFATLRAQEVGPVGDPFLQTPPEEEPESVIKASTIDEQLEKKAYNAGVEF
ncbi:MAG: hypothetical protein K2O66_07205, partial [Bacteroidales bacterium]|nr:hypothetical protein [Bacteroidales bacterium]